MRALQFVTSERTSSLQRVMLDRVRYVTGGGVKYILAFFALSLTLWPSLSTAGAGNGGFSRTPSNATQPSLHNRSAKDIASHSVIVSSGVKVLTETDISGQQISPLKLVRSYNSTNKSVGIFGAGWRSNFDPALQFTLNNGTVCAAVPGVTTACVTSSSGVKTIGLIRIDGSMSSYTWNSSTSRFESSSTDAVDWFVVGANNTWVLQSKTGAYEQYTQTGFISSSKDAYGVGWTFNYSSNYLQTAVKSNGQTFKFGWSGSKVATVTDPSLNIYQYGYNSNGYLSSVIYPGTPTHTRTYQYGNASLPLAVTGITVDGVAYSSYAYNSSGLISSSGLVNGVNTLGFTYNGNATTITNSQSAVTVNTYTTVNNQNLVSNTAQSGITNASYTSTSASYTYDTNGHPLTGLDPLGNQSKYQYASNGLVLDVKTGINSALPGQQREDQYTWSGITSGTDTGGLTYNNQLQTHSQLDANGNVVVTTGYTFYPSSSPAVNRIQSITVTNLSPNGVYNQAQTTNYTYQFYASGIPSQVAIAGPLAGPSGYVVQNYDANGDLSSIVDAAGNTTSYSNFNVLGQPQTTTDPNGFAVSRTYDVFGHVLTQTRTLDSVTATTTFTYDGLGDLLSIAYPDGGSVAYTYDAEGRRSSMTTSDSSTTSSSGQVTITSKASIAWGYNSMSKLTSTVISGATTIKNCTSAIPGGGAGTNSCSTGTSNVTYYSHSQGYDNLGRLISDLGSNGQNFTFTYDQDGNVLTQKDALGNTTTYTYSAHNQVQSVQDPLGHLSRYTYDALGNPAMVTDPRGNVTRYAYDGFSHLVQLISPDTGTTNYAYDAQNRLASKTRADGTTTSYYYDSLNRPYQVTAGSQTITYTYDSCTNGKTRLCGFGDPSGSTSYTYRQNGQLTSQTTTIAGQSSWGIQWAYDTVDRLAKLTYPDGSTVSYAYNAMQNPTSLTTVVGGVSKTVAAVGYTAMTLGPASTISYGNGILATLGYDKDYRLSSLATAGVQTYTYGYDTANRLNPLTNNLTPSNTESLGYDGQSQLTGVTSSGLGNQSVNLDANGNRTSSTNGSYNYSYTVDPYSNRITANSGSSVDTYGFDSLGNTTSDSSSGGVGTFGYDSFNHMTSVTLVPTGGSSYTENYSYNALGQRARKAGFAGNYNYIYGPDGTLLAETAQNSTSIASEYIYLGGQPIGLIRNGALYYIHDDHLGRPEVVTNSSGAVVWRAVGTAFSSTVTTDTIGGLNIGFPGQYYDAESGLYYNMNRYYNPSMGRYLQSDPIGLAGGLNTYAYVHGNPISFVDPYGYWRFPDYIAANINIAIPNPWTMTLVGWSGTASIDRYGDVFFSPIGVGFGKSATIVSGSVTLNWLDGSGIPSLNQLNNFLSANGFSGAVGFFGGVARSYTPGAGWSTGVGFVSPQAGISYNYSFYGGNIFGSSTSDEANSAGGAGGAGGGNNSPSNGDDNSDNDSIGNPDGSGNTSGSDSPTSSSGSGSDGGGNCCCIVDKDTGAILYCESF